MKKIFTIMLFVLSTALLYSQALQPVAIGMDEKNNVSWQSFEGYTLDNERVKVNLPVSDWYPGETITAYYDNSVGEYFPWGAGIHEICLGMPWDTIEQPALPITTHNNRELYRIELMDCNSRMEILLWYPQDGVLYDGDQIWVSMKDRGIYEKDSQGTVLATVRCMTWVRSVTKKIEGL